MGIFSFFRRLAADPTANTIVIAAVSLIPLLGMVGGAVDASRYYMTTTRLQAACDAGALAARRAMSDDEFTSEHKDIGLDFFDQNYKDGLFGLESRARNYTSGDDGVVTGTATGKLPTSLMHIFGYEEFDVSVTCSADINISNTDITFVLDVTGSMAWQANGTNCGTSNGVWNICPDSRIEGLRDAVMTFYDTVEESTSPQAQVRYGMVPYSTSANVGAELMAANPDWLAKSHTYQSREANFQLVPGEYEEVSKTVLGITVTDGWWNRVNQLQTAWVSNKSQCNALRPEERIELNDELGPFGQQSQVQNGSTRTTVYNDTNEAIYRYEPIANFRSRDGRCSYGWRRYDGTGDVLWELVEEQGEPVEQFANWTYKPVTFDLTGLYDDNVLQLPIGNDGSMTNVSWDGCIEEAETVSDATFNPIPAGANDLNINLVPDGSDEYWKPALPDAVWKREDPNNTLSNLTQTANESRPSYFCSRPAFRLREIGDDQPFTRQDLRNYVDALQPIGATYHDVGMIWGARFASPRGIFAADNESAPNGDAISRHIVFMTDGELSTNSEVYGLYGVEWWDRRVTDDGSTSQANERHAERFQAACRAARNENISVWVVAFGTTLTQNLINCATPGRTFTATDSDQLRDRFQEIAQRIAALRLTQ